MACNAPIFSRIAKIEPPYSILDCADAINRLRAILESQSSLIAECDSEVLLGEQVRYGISYVLTGVADAMDEIRTALCQKNTPENE
jgi:hypothetical protein